MTAPAGKFYVHCGQWIDNLLSLEAQKFADCVFSALEPAQPNAVMPTLKKAIVAPLVPPPHFRAIVIFLNAIRPIALV